MPFVRGSSAALLFALISLMGYPGGVLLPAFGGRVMQGGPHTLGWLSTASGVGALGSGLSLTPRRSTAGLSRMPRVATAMLGPNPAPIGGST